MTDHIKQIEELIAAGEKAEQTIVNYVENNEDCYPVNDINRFPIANVFSYGDAKFIQTTYNSRPAIKALLEENKRLREAVALIATKPLGGVLEDYICARQLQDIARQALGGSDE